jgi:hypothetical protein
MLYASEQGVSLPLGYLNSNLGRWDTTLCMGLKLEEKIKLPYAQIKMQLFECVVIFLLS